MSISVSDGILLGAIVPKSRIIKSSNKYVSSDEMLNILSGSKKPDENFTLEDAIDHINNIIKMNGENATAICDVNDPFNKESDYYVGIFWEWSNRSSMKLDDKWKPLFLEVGEIEAEKITLKQRVFDITSKVVKDLKESEIKMYEVRFFE